MRKSIIFLLIVLLTPVSGRSQELKFGYVEDQRILNQLPAVKEVQRILDQETTLWEKRFKERQLFLKAYVDSVTALKAGLEKARQDTSKTSKPEKQPEVSVNLPAPGDSAVADSSGGKSVSAAKVEKKASADTLAMLSEIARLESELDKAKKDVVAFYHRIYGEDGILNRRNAELSQSILEKINRVIAETGEKQNVSIVFDSSILFYIDQDLNLTNQVMQALGFQQPGAP